MEVDESKKEDYSEAMNDPAFLQVRTQDYNEISYIGCQLKAALY